MSSFKFEGANELARNLMKAAQDLAEGVEEAMDQTQAAVAKEASDTVPYDTGNLQSSLKVKDIKKKRGSWEAEVMYSGKKAPYAIVQHQNLSMTHPGPKNRRPARGAKGKPRWLTESIKTEEPEYLPRLKKSVEKRWRMSLR